MNNQPTTIKDNLLFDGTLLDVLLLKASGVNVTFGYNADDIRVKDKKLASVISNYIKIANDTNISNYYKTSVLPLYYPVKLSVPPIAYHARAVTKAFDSFTQTYKSNNNAIKLTYTPKNEIALLENIAWVYGSNVNNVSYMDIVRILETWALNLTIAAKNSVILNIESTMSVSDVLLLLNKLPSATASIQPLSAQHGYIDIGNAPLDTTDKLESAFDEATHFALLANADTYLLMGHLTNCQLTLNLQDVLYIYKNTINGSEFLTNVMSKINRTFEERFPIVSETIATI